MEKTVGKNIYIPANKYSFSIVTILIWYLLEFSSPNLVLLLIDTAQTFWAEYDAIGYTRPI